MRFKLGAPRPFLPKFTSLSFHYAAMQCNNDRQRAAHAIPERRTDDGQKRRSVGAFIQQRRQQRDVRESLPLRIGRKNAMWGLRAVLYKGSEHLLIKELKCYKHLPGNLIWEMQHTFMPSLSLCDQSISKHLNNFNQKTSTKLSMQGRFKHRGDLFKGHGSRI